jgi:hypothetical protein
MFVSLALIFVSSHTHQQFLITCARVKSKLGCRNYSREKVAEIFVKRSKSPAEAAAAARVFFSAWGLLPFSTFLPPPLIYRINVAGHDAPFSASAHSIGLLHSMEF